LSDSGFLHFQQPDKSSNIKMTAERTGEENMKQMWAGAVVTPEQVIEDGLVVTEGKQIVYAGPRAEWREPWDGNVNEVKGGWIWPGLIDTHIHGMAGADVMDGTPEALSVISQGLVRYGVTGFLATTMTGDVPSLLQVVRNAAQKAEETAVPTGAKVLGIHLEGPWINQAYKGAQNEKFVANPTLDQVEQIYAAAGGWLRTVTIAPELPGAEEAIRFLRSKGVIVSAGHTGAKFDQVEEAIAHGVGHFTHCFNAMRGLHHREPGVVGAVMLHDELSTELIADGIHVHPAVMKILHKIKRQNRIALISDAMRATGMGEGEYDLGGQTVRVTGEEATLADGTLAGSILTLNKAVSNMVTMCDVPLHEAVRMASLTPAEVIGVDQRKGKLQSGYDADLTIVNRKFEVLATIVEGTVVYQI
jgi:N-acetylglucosamine-6-phosphate deacetylase